MLRRTTTGIRDRVTSIGTRDHLLLRARLPATGADPAGIAPRLHRERLIRDDDHRRLLLLEAFGILIGNNDRHFGNICFFADELASRPTLELAPSFDMLPMSLAPNAGGVPQLTHAPSPRANLLSVWDEAADLAQEFWSRVSEESSISDAFRAAASSWATTVPSL